MYFCSLFVFRVEALNPLFHPIFYVVGAYQSDMGDMRFSGSHVQVRNFAVKVERCLALASVFVLHSFSNSNKRRKFFLDWRRKIC